MYTVIPINAATTPVEPVLIKTVAGFKKIPVPITYEIE